MSLVAPRNRLETAEFVITTIRALGFDPHPSSRLMKMHKVLTEQSGVISPEHPEFRIALEADRDMVQLEFIFEQEHARDTHPGLVERLKPLCLDAVLPQGGASKSKGRDTQLELYAAALCQAADFNPVDYAEPDISCDVQGTIIGLACKRLKSEASADARIRQARDQIVRSRIPGVIVVETTIALNSGNAPMLAQLPDQELNQLYQLAMQRFVDRHIRNISQTTRHTLVIGIALHDSVIRFEADRTWSQTAMTFRVPTSADIGGATYSRRLSTAIPALFHMLNT